MDGIGGSQRVKRQSRREGEGGWEKKRYTGAERRKRSISCPSPSVVLLLARLFLCFPLLLVRDISSGRDEERREKRGGREREKERERARDSSSFWMSQAQVRRRGKDEQEAG